jgi:hypothetical protein
MNYINNQNLSPLGEVVQIDQMNTEVSPNLLRGEQGTFLMVNIFVKRLQKFI